MIGMEPYKTIEERYCIIKGKNIPVEIISRGPNQREERCTNLENCVEEHGSCKNRIWSAR